MDLDCEGVLSVAVEGTWFFDKIKEGEKNPDEYGTHKSFRWPHQQGHALITGIREQIGFLINLNRNHWVAVVLDFTSSTIWYGDSLALENKIPNDISCVLDWWTHFHSGHIFEHKPLPISMQRDGHSCSLLLWNALVVFFSAGKHTLLDAGKAADGRLEVFLRIVE